MADADSGTVVPAGDGGTGTSSSFAADIEPLIGAACMSCHRAGGAASSSALVLTGEARADFSQVTALIDLAAPSDSRLVTKASGRAHGGGTVFAAGTAGLQTLIAWISAGAHP